MTYEKTEVKETKNIGKTVSNKAYKHAVIKHSTAHTLFILAGKHKMALVVMWAVAITALYIFPPLPEVLVGLIP